MANGRPWYKRDGSAVVMGTLHMPSSDHKWAYSAIIDMLNDRDRPIPDDAGFICGFTGLSKRRWRDVREFLLHDRDANGDTRLFIDERGDISNPRFARELAERKAEREKAAEFGREGGKVSAAKRAAAQGDLDLENTDGTDFAAARAREEQPKPEKKSRKSRDKPEINGGFRDHFPKIIDDEQAEINDLAQAPPQPIRAREEVRGKSREEEDSHSSRFPNPPRESNLLLRETDWDHVELAAHFMRMAGVSDIQPGTVIASQQIVRSWLDNGIGLDTIETLIVRRRDAASSPIRSLKYFDDAIRKAHSKTEHPRNGKPATSLDDIRDPVLRRYLANRPQGRVDH